MPPLSSFEFDVLLRHSAKDNTVVRAIAERLRADGLRVWFNEWEVKPGDNVLAKIDHGLERSRVLVLFISVNAFASDWARLESSTSRFRDPLNKERRFIVVRLDDVLIKRVLAQFIYVDWLSGDREQAYAKLLSACRTPATLKPTRRKVRRAHKVLRISPEAVVHRVALSLDQKRMLTSSNRALQVWDFETGRCLHTLEGHTQGLWSVALSTDNRRALSSSDDKTIRLWDLERGICLRVLEGHDRQVLSVVWSNDQRHAFSCSSDGTARLWDLDSGQCLSVFKGSDTAGPTSVALRPDQRQALSAAIGLQLWDVETGRRLRVLEGHTAVVWGLAWSANGSHVLSGSSDMTVRLWEVETGRCLRVLEGHNKEVDMVAFSADQRCAISASIDQTARLWDLETGRCMYVLKGHGRAWSIDQNHALSSAEGGRFRFWNLSDFEVNSRVSPIADQVQYSNAKVLLVGDTGVGKSGMAERLVRKRFVPTKSSHARKAFVLESEIEKEPNGVSLHKETMLWDLAGQPAYRLVHQLSMEDAVLACVLFDNRNETNPFEGAAYWSQALDQARTNSKLTKLLIASRIDVGGLPAGKERIEAFRQENGFAQFIATSASTGEGCDALLEMIRRGIPWDEVPKVTTVGTLASVRDFFGKLKAQNGAPDSVDGKRDGPALLTVAALHEGFVADFGEKIPLDEFISHLHRLEATDVVDLLVFHTTGAEPRSETLVLLDPTRVDAYASALLVAAKDEPDGPGHLLESRVRHGEFRLEKNERISDRESERHVLGFVMENLLARDLALRERIKGEDYIVFPSQCTAELRFPGAAAFGVAFDFAGPVRSIYATLIAQLAHYEGFKKREFFQDAAAYSAEASRRCIVRLRDRGHGQGELEVLFDRETSSTVRQGFIEFVGKHVEAKSNSGTVTKRHAYHCANTKCEEPFDDRVVKANLAARRTDLLCPYCRKKTRLVNLLVEPTAAAESIAAKIDTDAKAGRQRMTAGWVIRAKNDENKFDVFLSHNSKDKAAVERIAKRLLSVGIRPWLDKWNLSPGDTVSDALEHAIKTISCAALCFGPADAGKWHIMEIRAYVERWASKDARMIPVILPGVIEAPELPLFVRQTLWVDMRRWEDAKDDGLYRLVCGILAKAPGDSPRMKFGAREVAEWQGIDSQLS
jgi:small GTP-binding protein